jgi:hypothetical protein
VLPDLVQGGHHHRKGLVRAALALAQRAHCLCVRRITGQVKPAQALDRQDRAPAEQASRSRDRVLAGLHRGQACSRLRRAGNELQARAAGRARVRLRVKAAIARVVVLSLAVRAHRKDAHRGVRPVVRHVGDNGKARAAVRAIGERVPIAAVGGIQKLAQAVRARGGVRRNERVAPFLAFGMADLEATVAMQRRLAYLDPLDARQWRCFCTQGSAKGGDGLCRPLDLDLDAARVIEHPPAKLKALRKVKHERPKADALDHASDADSPANPI